MNPTVSIVVPVYNREVEFRRALASIRAQSYSDFEVLVVDDESTTPVRPIVEEFDDRFRYIRNEKNAGCTGARAIAYAEASGDFVMQLDSDNEYEPDAVSSAVHLLEANPQVDGVSGQYRFHDGTRVHFRSGPRVITPQMYREGQSVGCDMVGAVRRSVVDEWLAKDRSYFNFDSHIWLTYHSQHDHLMVPEVWGTFHEDASVRISGSVDERNFRDTAVFVEEHEPIFGSARHLPLDAVLLGRWARQRSAGGPAVRQLESWMDKRGLGQMSRAIRAGARSAARRVRGERWFL